MDVHRRQVGLTVVIEEPKFDWPVGEATRHHEGLGVVVGFDQIDGVRHHVADRAGIERLIGHGECYSFGKVSSGSIPSKETV